MNFRDTDVIENGLESPLDELEQISAISEIPAYKSANQELAGVLKNLRKLEQHIKGKTIMLHEHCISDSTISNIAHMK